MRKFTLLTVTMAVALVTAAALKALAPAKLATTTPQSASMSIEELHRQVDVRSLPVLEVKDPL